MAIWQPPSINQGWWTFNAAAGTPGVGVPGGIDQYLSGGINDRAVTGTLVDITQAPYSADATGVIAVDAILQQAIDDASGPTVIYFPAGTFLFDDGFINTGVKNDVTIRGAGPGITIFHCSTSTVAKVISFNDPGVFGTGEQTVSGTKTKGTTTLAISDTTGYAEGRLVLVSYRNETDNARIQAGAIPTWHSQGAPFALAMLAKITGVVADTSITIDPPLPGDGTHVEMRTSLQAFDGRKSGWGFEDFSVTFDADNHPFTFINFDTCEYCWVYNVEFPDFGRTTDNGDCIHFHVGYRNEVRRCVMNFSSGASSDGAIGIHALTSSVIVDNILSGVQDTGVYENGGSINNVIVYNFQEDGTLFDAHGPHPCLNIFEGNYAKTLREDGYYGSSSQETLFGNCFTDQVPLQFQRFKRKIVVAKNILGTDGNGGFNLISWGNPNIGNGYANGFSGPTGLSDQAGQFDYWQPGFETPFTYQIQPSDISAGDFGDDWGITGTLTTRTSDTVGVFTVSGGNWFTGPSSTGAATLSPCARWNDDVDSIGGTPSDLVTGVSGSEVTITFAGGVLPAEGTEVTLWPGPAGWQERDLDAQASSTIAGNRMADGAGTGAVVNSIAPDTFPDSLLFEAAPDWWPGSLAWPPFDPDNYSTKDPERIPAGYRFVNGEDAPDGGAVPDAPTGLTLTPFGS